MKRNQISEFLYIFYNRKHINRSELNELKNIIHKIDSDVYLKLMILTRNRKVMKILKLRKDYEESKQISKGLNKEQKKFLIDSYSLENINEKLNKFLKIAVKQENYEYCAMIQKYLN